MRRDHQSRGAGLELRQIVERPHGCAFRAEVDEQHVPSRDGALDAGEQHQATLARVGQVGSRVEVPVMERDGDDLIAQIGRAVEELDGRVRNAIFGIEVGMGMELGLQHEISIGFQGCSATGAQDCQGPSSVARRLIVAQFVSWLPRSIIARP